MEIWKDVIGYEGFYAVSNLGNVRSSDILISASGKKQYLKKGRILAKAINGAGYPLVCLHKNGKQKSYDVHLLVAKAFLDNPNNYPIINHKDEDKTNSAVENLEWCTFQYNCLYNGANKRGMEKVRKPIYQISVKDNSVKKWDSITDAVTSGYNKTCIHEVLRGEKKIYKNFYWRYANEQAK